MSTVRTKLLGVAVLAFSIQSASASYLDLTQKGSGSFGQGTFVWADSQSTGTGVIDSFLRIQANGTESGFNTNAGTPLDDKAGTKSILVSSFGQVNLNGVPSIRFLLDINEAGGNNPPNQERLSLDNLQVYVSTNPNIATLADLQSSATLRYDIDTAGACSSVSPASCTAPATSNGVNLDFSLNSGSGSGDMYFYLPASLFTAYQSGYYLYLYSSFGALGGGFESSDGIEEWARVDSPTAVPEPTTYAFVLSLLSSGVVLYKRRNATASKN